MLPVLQASMATMFTWGLTALGASLVFGTKKVNRKLLGAMLALAARAMVFVIAADLARQPGHRRHVRDGRFRRDDDAPCGAGVGG